MIYFSLFHRIKVLIKMGLAAFVVAFSVSVNAQTGPGGVGSSADNVLWLKAGVGTSTTIDSTAISFWNDTSGNANNSTQADALEQPLYISSGINSLPTIRFDGSNDHLTVLDNDNLDNTSGLSIFVAAQPNTPDVTPRGIVSKRNDSGAEEAYYLFTHFLSNIYFNARTDRINGSDVVTDQPQLFSAIYNGTIVTAAQRSRIIYNGIQNGIGNGPGTIGNMASDLHIGILNPGYVAGGFRGDISEVIIYRSALGSAKQIIIENYLGAKYNLTTANRLYYPINSYSYGAAGIGEEADGEHSESASAGLYLTALTGLNIGDYIFVSHNDTANNASTFRSDPEITASGAEKAYNRIWYLDTINSPAAQIAFDFSEAVDGGLFPTNISNYILMYRTGVSGDFARVKAADGIKSGDQVFFNLTDVELPTGYYTFGTEDSIASPLEGISERTWYALASGDWDTWDYWTLDPSGALPNNPGHEIPSAIDKVVIHTGKTITLTTDNKSLSSITVDGILQMGTSSGHNFTEIKGSGRIRLASDNFPLGDATHFISSGQGEGTVVWQGGDYDLTTAHTFFNVEVDLDNPTDTVKIIADYTLNGALVLETGILQINNTSSTNLSISVLGDVTIEEDGQILTGTGNARHQFDMYGDFTNNGIVKFTNRTAAILNSEATDGIVDANFLNDFNNQTILCYDTTNFYRIEIDKGVDITYILDIQASNSDYFNLFGYANQGHNSTAQLDDGAAAPGDRNPNALGLYRGTVRIGGNVTIPDLNNSVNYVISEAAQLWVDGGTVTKRGGTAIVPYGVARVSAGTFEALVGSGFTLRDNGLIKVEGGVLNATQVRTSTNGAGNVGGYSQTGGDVTIDGSRAGAGTPNNQYAIFSLTYPGNVFTMTGGTLTVRGARSFYDGTAGLSGEWHGGGIFINSDPGNINVSGGTVIVDISSNTAATTNVFKIASKAPFYNFVMRKSSATSDDVFLLDSATSGVNSVDDFQTLPGQDLVVLNDFTIEGEESGAGYPDIDFYPITSATNINDVYIGGSFLIEAGAQYWTGIGGRRDRNYDAAARQPSDVNTTYFNQTIATSAIDTLYWGNLGDQFDYDGDLTNEDAENRAEFGHFILDRTTGNELRVVSPVGRGNNSITIDVNGDASVLSGTLDQGRLTYRTWGALTNYDRFGTWYESGNYPVAGGTPGTAQVRFREDPPVIINTTDNAIFGNVRFNVNPNTATVDFDSDVYIERMEFLRGEIYIKNHHLKMDYMWNVSDNVFEDVANSSLLDVTDNGRSGNNFIFTDGNASDGGVSIKIVQNSLNETRGRRRNNLSPITFPIGFTTDGGTTTYFRPAQVNVTGFQNDSGYVRIRPVSGELKTTDLTGTEVLQQYWRVSYSDFNTLPTNMAYRFYYRNQVGIAGVDLPTGSTTENTYVPGFVLDGGAFTRDYESSSLTNLDINDVYNSPYDADTRVLVFNGTSNAGEFIQGSYNGFVPVDANYTAGDTSRFTGPVEIFYNRRNNQGSWANTGSWFMDANQTIAATRVPAAGDVVILRGDYFTDNITVNGTREVAQINFVREGTYVDIESLPRLRLETTDNLTADRITGIGDLYLRHSLTNVATLTADIGEFASQDTSVIEFYTTQNGTYNVDVANFFPEVPTLRVYGQGSTLRTVTFNYDIKCKNLIIDGRSTLYVGGNYEVENLTRLGFTYYGRLQFPNIDTSYTLTTNNFLTRTAKGGEAELYRVNVEAGNAFAQTHKLIVKGDIDFEYWAGANAADNLYFDLYNSPTENNAILELQSEGSHALTNNFTNTQSTIDLYRLEMNKGIDQSSTFTINDSITLNGPTSGGGDKALELVNGTLVLDDPLIDIDLTTGDNHFSIPSSAGLEVRQGIVYANGNSGILLDGKLLVSGGEVNMSGGNNPIEYSASGNAELEVTDGTLIVGSQIRRGLTSSEGILNYNQSGGAVVIAENSAPQSNRGVLEILNSGSSFTHSGGSLNLVRQQVNPTFASLYLDPTTSSLSSGTTITLGNLSTPADQEFGVYSTINLQNLTVNTTNSPIAKMWTVPLTINDTLLIENGAEFDASGLDLNLYGDFINNGTFTANANTTYFLGATDQKIEGDSTRFYNLISQNTADLNLAAGNANIIIDNILSLESGTFNDNSNDVSVYGNINNEITHVYGGSNDGISLLGTSVQIMTGNGTYGKLSINGSGVSLPVGNTPTIKDFLKLESGVFSIGGNLLTLDSTCVIQEANPFSSNNMIQTNVSFTDNGVKRFFPKNVNSFIYPVGSGGKYTPVSVNTSQNSSSNGFLIVKPADEIHPSIVDDLETPDPEIVDQNNVLQYYWVLTGGGFIDFSSVVEMNYDINDVEYTIPYGDTNYITAKLLNDSSGNWYKYDDVSKFDEVNTKLIFDITDAADVDITGDYTAGVDGSTFNGAIPDQVPLYTSNGSGGILDWNDPATWVHDPGLPDIPNGARVLILAGDTVQTTSNYISAYTTEINGTLDVNTTFGNRVGNVYGTGTLYTERGSLPAGFFESFFSASGGTVDFGGSTNYSVLSNVSQVNNLVFSGTGIRELPNLNLAVVGDFTIDGDDATLNVINEFDQKTDIAGDIVFNNGTFDAGTGADAIVELNGTSGTQTISGTGSFTLGNAFNHVEINNANGISLSRPVDIDGNLAFTNGVISTSATNILTINNTSESAVSGSSTTSYVDGPMRKSIIDAGGFVFPVGDGVRFGQISVVNTSVTGTQFWEAEYYNANPHPTYDTSSHAASLNMISGNEYWRVSGPSGGQSNVVVRWDANSILPAMTADRPNNLHIAQWITGTPDEWQSVGSGPANITDNGINDGVIQTNGVVTLDEHYFTIATQEPAPLPTAGFLTLDTTICDGSTITLRVNVTGTPEYSVAVDDGTSTTTYSNASSPITFDVTPGSTITYTITQVTENTDGTPRSSTTTISGSPVVVTVIPIPTQYNVTGGGGYCSGTSGTLIGLDDSDLGINYTLMLSGSPVGSSVAGTGSAISFGLLTTAGTYTVEAEDASGTCSQTMTGNAVVSILPSPVITFIVDPSFDSICDGANTQIELSFISGTGDYDFTVNRVLNGVTTTYPYSNIAVAPNPYLFIPAPAPVWVNDGTADTDYAYRIATFTDNGNGCSTSIITSERVKVFKLPSTGSQHHISNTWGN